MVRRFALLVPLVTLASCAGPIAARVVRAPNHAIAGSLPAQTTAPQALGGALSAGVGVRRVPVDGGRISLRAVVIEPADEPFAPDGAEAEQWRRLPPITVRRPLGTVVVLHGLWGSAEITAPHGACLANAGFRCVLIDLRGHGESTGATISFGKHEADDLRDVLRILRADGTISGPTALVGFSYGASVALMAAGQGIGVRGVAAVAPFARLRDVAPNFARAFVGWLAWFATEGLADRVVARAGELGGFDPLADSPLAAAPAVRMPVLLVHGEKDTLVPPEQSALLDATLGGPHRRVLVPGQDHIEEVLDPGLSLPALLPWLERLLAPDAYRSVDGPLVGWTGEVLAPLSAAWAWRSAPADRTADWPRPAGGRNVRTWATVPPAWIGRDLELLLGTVTRADETYAGGVRIGGIDVVGLPVCRVHRVPGWLVGAHVEFTVRVLADKPGDGIRWAGGGTALLRPVRE